MGKLDLLASSAKGPIQKVETSPKPVWKAAKDLKLGDKVILKDGSTGTVTALEPVKERQTVYNFSVKDDHTYFVSDMGVLVHNQYKASEEVNENPSKKVITAEEALNEKLNGLGVTDQETRQNIRNTLAISDSREFNNFENTLINNKNCGVECLLRIPEALEYRNQRQEQLEQSIANEFNLTGEGVIGALNTPNKLRLGSTLYRGTTAINEVWQAYAVHGDHSNLQTITAGIEFVGSTLTADAAITTAEYFIYNKVSQFVGKGLYATAGQVAKGFNWAGKQLDTAGKRVIGAIDDLKAWRANRTTKFTDDIADHVKLRDFSVPRKNGIGGAHNLNEFLKHSKEFKVIRSINHPDIPGISTKTYRLFRKDKTGTLTEVLQNSKLRKTVYDPKVISDIDILKWGKEAAIQAKSVGSLTREWTGTASNGLVFRGYLNDAGKVRTFFPEF